MDVVIPFRGSRGELAALAHRLEGVRLRDGDTLLVVDNTPGGSGAPAGITLLRAAERATPGFARNQGAARGHAEWIVFIDADTEPSEDLLDRYFEPPPGPRTALIAGGIIDEIVPDNGPAPARYAYLRQTLSQDRTLSKGRWAFAQAANVACRRDAFAAVGGFRESIRAAEDADLSYRLKAAGWEIERREHAAVVHRSRRHLRPFVSQAALHGAGSAWLDRHYPGSFPARRRPGLVWWGVRMAARGIVGAARHSDRDELVRGLLEPLWEVAFEFGRSHSIEQPAGETKAAPRSAR